MTNIDVCEKWAPVQFGALMKKYLPYALRITLISPLKIIDCKYMYLNSYENCFHLINRMLNAIHVLV